MAKMSKLQRPIFVSNKKSEKVHPFVSNKLKQLTDKLTQDYVDMYMIMNNKAYTKNQHDANIFFKSMLNSYKMAETIINIYTGHLINEIEALKNIMHIIKQYHADCTTYFLAHPEESLIKTEPNNLDNHTLVNSVELRHNKKGESVNGYKRAQNDNVREFKSIDNTPQQSVNKYITIETYIDKKKIEKSNTDLGYLTIAKSNNCTNDSTKSKKQNTLDCHKNNIAKIESALICGNCNVSFKFTTIKDFIPDIDLNYHVIDGCLVPITTLSGNANCDYHDNVELYNC